MKNADARHAELALTCVVSTWLAGGAVGALGAEPEGFRPVTYSPPIGARVRCELITDRAGHKKTGGVGRSCWGFNQTNIVRTGAGVYALWWRDDLNLVVSRRAGEGTWEDSPPLPECPQNGVLLVDGEERVQVIGGDSASYHAVFDPPGQIGAFDVRRRAKADSRFGASVAPSGDILVAGGLPGMSWYVLDRDRDWTPVARGRVPHKTHRAYYFVVFDGKQGWTYCYDDYFVKGTGYLTLKTYLYHNRTVVDTPHAWRMTVASDVSDTLAGKARGGTGNEDLLVDRDGRVHLLCRRNRTPSTTNWASQGQSRSNDELLHVVVGSDGARQTVRLGNFSRGRLHQTADGTLHYLLEKGEWFHFDLWYAQGRADRPDAVSEPVELTIPTRIDHVFVSSPRAGGVAHDVIDCYWTEPYPGRTNRVWYGVVTPASRAPVATK